METCRNLVVICAEYCFNVQIYLDLNKCLVYFVGRRLDNFVTFLRQKCLDEANCRFLIGLPLLVLTRNTYKKYNT